MLTSAETGEKRLGLVDHLNQGSATFFALRTGLKLKFFRGPAFKKPRMFTNEYLLQLVYIITTLIQ